MAKIVHGRVLLEDAANGAPKRVVDRGRYTVLCISLIAAEVRPHFSCQIWRADGLDEGSPEGLLNVHDRVGPNTVKAKCAKDPLKRCRELLLNKWHRLIQIRQVGQAAVVNHVGEAVVLCDLALLVVVRRVIEGIDLPIVCSNWSSMVHHDVDHHPNVSSMAGLNKVDEVLLRPKMRIHGKEVFGPITVIPQRRVLNDR